MKEILSVICLIALTGCSLSEKEVNPEVESTIMSCDQLSCDQYCIENDYSTGTYQRCPNLPGEYRPEFCDSEYFFDYQNLTNYCQQYNIPSDGASRGCLCEK